MIIAKIPFPVKGKNNPKSEIDFMQTNVSYYFNLKKQFKDQKSMSL